MASTVLSVMIVIWITVIVLLKRVSGKNSAARRNISGSGSRRWYTEKAPGATASRRTARSSDGHWIRGEQDITCRQYGHNHSGSVEPQSRYIVHEEPTEGYIVLNGKKMLRTEADKYENSI